MKNFNNIFVLIFSLVLVKLDIQAQLFSVNLGSSSAPKFAKISIDNSNYSLLSITKEWNDQVVGQEVYLNTIKLIGDYKIDNNKVCLDYFNYNYFIISFNENTPSLYLDKLIDPSISNGYLHFGPSTQGGSSAKGGGDFTYWCDCGAHNPNGPGECVSSFQNDVIRCVSTGCGECVGSVIEKSKFNGGGILIQTKKDVIGYNDKTRF
jgi:hypothetical protein